MIKGSCLCESIGYEIKALEGPLVHCHCNFCRKTHTAVFSSNLTVAKENFSIVTGKSSLSFYESSPGKKRYFCINCGSSLWHTKEISPDLLTIKAGSIDEFPDFEQQGFSSYHIHCNADKPWLNYEGMIKYGEVKR